MEQLKTDPALLAAIRAASTHVMTPAERQAQRRSFVIGQIWGSYPDMSREEVGAIVDKALGEDPAALASAPPAPTPEAGRDPLVAYLDRQWAWSKETFGPALRTHGIVQHITKELREIEAEPHDLAEWVDVIILAMDGFWRHGGKPADLVPAMQAKQDRNFARTWPDWRTMREDQAIEHDRSGEVPPPPAEDLAGQGEPVAEQTRTDAVEALYTVIDREMWADGWSTAHPGHKALKQLKALALAVPAPSRPADREEIARAMCRHQIAVNRSLWGRDEPIADESLRRAEDNGWQQWASFADAILECLTHPDREGKGGER